MMQFEIVDGKKIIFDLDDVLTYTNVHFRRYMDEAVNTLGDLLNLSDHRFEQFVAEFERLNIDFFAIHGVDESRWLGILHRMQDTFFELSDEVIREVLPIFAKIYNEAPPLRPHALGLAQDLFDVGLELSILTHAAQDVTDLKDKTHNLSKIFHPIDSVPPHDKKDRIAFYRHIRKLGVDPEDVIIIEDNPYNILEAIAAGVPAWQIIWFRGPNTPAHLREAQVPKGVYEIRELQLLPWVIRSILFAERDQLEPASDSL